MTGPVKPPVGPAGSVPTTPSEARAPSAADFRVTLEPTESPSKSAATGRAAELEALVAALREGHLEPGRAVEALVARALDSSMARGLTASGRVALEQHLRQMLTDDPAMAQLVRDLERGR